MEWPDASSERFGNTNDSIAKAVTGDGDWCVVAGGQRSRTPATPTTITKMTIYEFSLALGAAGLGIMGLSGFAHTIGGDYGAPPGPSSHTGHHSGSVRGGMRGARGGGRVGVRALWA